MSFVPNSTLQTTLTGNPYRSIWQNAWPMLLIMVFNFLVGVTDVYVAGLIGSEIQAAIGFIAQLYFLLIILANAIGIGTVSLVSQASGADQTGDLIHMARQSLLFGILTAAVLSLGGIGAPAWIVRVSGFPGEIQAVGTAFLRIFALALGPNYFLIISGAVFRARGEPQKPLLVMTVVSGLNILLEFGLVFGYGPLPEMGYPGIALATAISFLVGTLITLFQLLTPSWRAVFRPPFRLDWGYLRVLFFRSWPAALLQLSWNAGSVVLYNLLGGFGRESIAALAAFSNGLRLEAIIYLPAFALQMAASVMVGQNLGAGLTDRAARLGWQTAGIGALVLGLLAAIIYGWSTTLAGFLTTDPVVFRETVNYLKINMLAEPFMAVSLALAGGLMGAGATRTPLYVVSTAMWLIRLPLAWVLAFHLALGPSGIWWAMTLSMIIQGGLMAWRFKAGNWKTAGKG
ncbi:MAG: MATE family efflux transporter [Deltaproteobacteria bacterium]|nr:MATE family efflux transporter [Deltaproteobacteria bacterium]